MKKVTILLILAIAVCSIVAKTTVTQISNNSYKVIWDIPAWKLNTQGDYLYLQATELGYGSTVGAPLIPYDECKIAVPDGGTININVSNQSTKEITLEKRLQPIPAIGYDGKTDTYTYTINEKLYATTPGKSIEAMPAERYRKLNFVPIRINPFIYDGKNKLTVTTGIEFTVTINGDINAKSSLPADELTSLISKSMLNPAQALNWQTSEKAAINYADFSRADYWVKLETDKDGMYKITPSQLSMLPLADIDPASFRMFTTGGELQSEFTNYAGPVFKEVPIYVRDTDNTFNSSDYILFYGRDREGLDMNQTISSSQYINPYSKNGCYWLAFGGTFPGSPMRITMQSAQATFDSVAVTSPETVRVENDIYQYSSIGFDWLYSKLFGNSTADYQYSIDLEDLEASKAQTLTMGLTEEYNRNGSNKTHTVQISANGLPLKNVENQVQQWLWYGLSDMTISHTGLNFLNGNNDLLIDVIRSYTDNLYLDYYQVLYQKKLIKRSKQFMVSIPGSYANRKIQYNFTGNNSTIRVFQTNISSDTYAVSELPVNTLTSGFNFVGNAGTSTKYFVTQDSDFYTPLSIQNITPTDIANVSQAFDNIIITPPDFTTQAQSLAAMYMLKWHKKSKIVLLQDIFNQFNGGMPDPNAIRQYLKFCVNNYPGPAITSVTLLGTGTNDWRNFSGQSANKNKMIVYQKDTTTSDDYYATLNTIQYPELAIGRYPVRNASDMNIMLQNLDNYINNPTPGIWRNSMVMLADDLNNGSTTGEYSHSQQLQETSELINRSILLDKIFAIDYEYDEFQNKPRAKDDLFKEINEGKLVWYYIGHGSFDTLGAEDYFKGALDMALFNNPGKLPLFIAASCDVAQFDSFGFDCAAEKVVLNNNKGAIASIAATRESSGPANVALMEQYFNYSLNLHNPVGYSLIKAKFTYSDFSNNERYNLLGDPLISVCTPERDSTLSLVTTSKDAVLNARATVNFHGEFSTPGLVDSTSIYVFNSDVVKVMTDHDHSHYDFRGTNIFRGCSSVTNSQYLGSFIVPDDVTTGNTGFMVSYLWDPIKQKDYVNYASGITLSDQAVEVTNNDVPAIQIFLNSEDYADGDLVSPNPVLIAKISDDNGINITNNPGHSIQLILDRTASITNVTNYFTYDTDSGTHGRLQYPMSDLSDGQHQLQVIAFDNFNRPSVASTSFTVSNTGVLKIKNFLPYPNPMKKDGYFTFELSESADVKLAIYTIRGKKIRTLTASVNKGYNQLYWDGRDADGDLLANNTYFIKLTAKSSTGKDKTEKTEKLIIYH